jgi:hypothetical protein
MFRVGDTILSEEIASSKFACNISRCKGACCVVGESGAPVSKDEIQSIRDAYKALKTELRPEAVKTVEKLGIVQGNDEDGYEISCVDERECVFVDYTDEGVGVCAIQRAFLQNRVDWEKPVSCHLYPVRLKKIGEFEYANFEYMPDICESGCLNGNENGIYLSDFLESAFIRRYGRKWYNEFKGKCNEIRQGSFARKC